MPVKEFAAVRPVRVRERPYLIRHQLLNLPQVTIANAVLLQLADGAEGILRSGSPVAGGAGEDMRHLGQRAPPGVGVSRPRGDESEGLETPFGSGYFRSIADVWSVGLPSISTVEATERLVANDCLPPGAERRSRRRFRHGARASTDARRFAGYRRHLVSIRLLDRADRRQSTDQRPGLETPIAADIRSVAGISLLRAEGRSRFANCRAVRSARRDRLSRSLSP